MNRFFNAKAQRRQVRREILCAFADKPSTVCPPPNLPPLGGGVDRIRCLVYSLPQRGRVGEGVPTGDSLLLRDGFFPVLGFVNNLWRLCTFALTVCFFIPQEKPHATFDQW
ncbi:MAG: hypothetical protein LBL69_07030 [Zoogloeaceae bacterium]|jgi:hypothetical protein|nr:hypothetical protein [Zoogloeaceae bacterium]